MNYYEEIKNKIIDNEIYNKVKDYSKNRSDLDTYCKVGKLLLEAKKTLWRRNNKRIIKKIN